jgi:hypothetical protein
MIGKILEESQAISQGLSGTDLTINKEAKPCRD